MTTRSLFSTRSLFQRLYLRETGDCWNAQALGAGGRPIIYRGGADPPPPDTPPPQYRPCCLKRRGETLDILQKDSLTIPNGLILVKRRPWNGFCSWADKPIAERCAARRWRTSKSATSPARSNVAREKGPAENNQKSRFVTLQTRSQACDPIILPSFAVSNVHICAAPVTRSIVPITEDDPRESLWLPLNPTRASSMVSICATTGNPDTVRWARLRIEPTFLTGS